MNTITITTPQNIELEYELGSLSDRIGGSLIDGIIKTSYAIIVLATMNFWIHGSFSGSNIFIILLLASPFIFYNLLSELLLNGQSVGKKVMGIKVISLSGEQPSFSQYLNRWVFRLIDFTLSGYMVGVIMVAATERKQRLGDLVAGTVLIKTAPRTELITTLYAPTDAATYVVTYPEVINLKDQDIALLKEIILSVRQTNNIMLATQAQIKIETILKIKSRFINPIDFLQTVLSDYNHLTSQL
jgi:uncharacterized RDD family membrane protein YckC